MTDTEFLADQLRRAHQGEAWHGPALREILTGVTAGMARARPVPHAHTIWELARHVSAWLAAVGRRLHGESVELPDAEDWPAMGDGTEAAWQSTLVTLDRETSRLQETISALPGQALQHGVPGRDYSIRFMLEGVVQHHLYHAGQIALLRKMLSASR